MSAQATSWASRSRSRSQIERDAALVGIQRQEQAALLRVGRAAGKRPAPPGQVSTRFFDLDHIGSQIGHDFAGV